MLTQSMWNILLTCFFSFVIFVYLWVTKYVFPLTMGQNHNWFIRCEMLTIWLHVKKIFIGHVVAVYIKWFLKFSIVVIINIRLHSNVCMPLRFGSCIIDGRIVYLWRTCIIVHRSIKKLPLRWQQWYRKENGKCSTS